MTYNLNDQKQYMEALDFIEIAKQNKWHVTLEKKRESRTSQQNKYYWPSVCCIWRSEKQS